MNRILTFILIAVVCLGAMLMTACQQHEHSYTETVITAPTCTEGGESEYTCECGETYKAETAPAGHSFGEGVVVDPTCNAEGYTEYVCTECEYVKQDTFVASDKENHNYELVDSKAPNCTEWGYTKEVCEYCNDEIITELEPVHTLIGSWVVFKQPTCTEAGEERQYCTSCSYYATREIPAQHKYEKRYDVTVEPTCDEAGYVLHTCSGCGYQLKDNFVPAYGHTWVLIDDDEWTTSKEATCTEYGEEFRKCETCEYVEKRYTDYAHEYTEEVKAPTCKDFGYTTFTCTICGHTEIGAYTEPQHTFGEWVIEAAPTCQNIGMEKRACEYCGYEEKQVIAPQHVYNNVTVVEPTKFNSGYTLHACDCGDSYKDTFVSAFGSEGLEFQLRVIWDAEKEENVYVYVLTGLGTCTDTEVAIPSEYNGYPVAVIGNMVFYGRDDITAIYIPESVTKIEIGSFWYCKGLVEIHYEGTRIEWMAINMPSDWNKHLDTFYIICEDGTIVVNE